MKVCFILIMSLFIITITFGQTAEDLNKNGYLKYKEKKYLEALSLFDKAIEADNTYYLAQYNYSCTASLILANYDHYYTDKDEFPETYVYRRLDLEEKSLAALRKTLELKPDYKRKALKDPDLEYIRGFYEYYEILGYDFSNLITIFKIITNVTHWASPGDGMIDPMYKIVFHKDKSFSLYDYVNWDDTADCEKEYKGTFKIYNENKEIIIEINFDQQRDGEKIFKMKWEQNGKLLRMDPRFWEPYFNEDYYQFLPNYESHFSA